MSKDYYKILGINRNASKDEIKRAYRKFAYQHHPDKGGDERKFKEINEAYQVLSNSEKRQQYDQFGTTFEGFRGGQGFDWGDVFKGFSAQGGPASGWYGRRINLEDLFSDIFGDFFTGAGFSRTRPRSRKNIVLDMEVDLKDILKGVEKEIRLEDLNIKINIKPKASQKTVKEIKKLIKKLKKQGI